MRRFGGGNKSCGALDTAHKMGKVLTYNSRVTAAGRSDALGGCQKLDRLRVTYADSPAYFGEAGGFACISFYYNQLNVGTLTVFANTTSTNDIPGINGVVPYTPPGYIDDVPVTYINLMYVIGGAIGIVLITGLVILITRRKHRRFNYASKKLHF